MQVSLKAARVNKGLSQQQAAQELGVSVDTLRSWERGRTYPDVRSIKSIEQIYGVSYNDLIFLPHKTL